MKGNVTYTNFGYADEGSGAWVIGDATESGAWSSGDPFDVSFEYQGLCQGACLHTLQVTDFQPLSPNSVSFEGTGFYAATPTWTETFTGKIVGNEIKLTLNADDDGAMYGWNLTKLVGTIAPDGSIAGTWSDDMLRSGAFEIGSGAVSEAFSFTTTPTCVNVNPANHTATFGYTIPAGAPTAVAGRPVVVKVFDGGTSGAVNDTYKHQFAVEKGSCTPIDTIVNFPIESGNLVVHG